MRQDLIGNTSARGASNTMMSISFDPAPQSVSMCSFINSSCQEIHYLQEDAHATVLNVSDAEGQDSTIGFFGVFDGHGGKEVALFAAKHLVRLVLHIAWTTTCSDYFKAFSATSNLLLRTVTACQSCRRDYLTSTEVH